MYVLVAARKIGRYNFLMVGRKLGSIYVVGRKLGSIYVVGRKLGNLYVVARKLGSICPCGCHGIGQYMFLWLPKVVRDQKDFRWGQIQFRIPVVHYM